jgi:hypothetical protein
LWPAESSKRESCSQIWDSLEDRTRRLHSEATRLVSGSDLVRVLEYLPKPSPCWWVAPGIWGRYPCLQSKVRSTQHVPFRTCQPPKLHGKLLLVNEHPFLFPGRPVPTFIRQTAPYTAPENLEEKKSYLLYNRAPSPLAFAFTAHCLLLAVHLQPQRDYLSPTTTTTYRLAPGSGPHHHLHHLHSKTAHAYHLTCEQSHQQ